MKSHLSPVITIDGASGTGKGTISRIIAKLLGFNLLDSGALYRVLALAAIKHKVALNDATTLTLLAEHLDVQFLMHEEGICTIRLEGEDVTTTIRTEPIGDAASQVAVIPTVREALLSRQRSFRESPGLVADGRDMGTVVFPDADLSIFLTASSQERAQRRFKQLKDQGENVSLERLVEELRKRDIRDQERAVAPLRPAANAICIDTDHLTIDAVVERILSEINEKKAFPVTFTARSHIEVRVTE